MRTREPKIFSQFRVVGATGDPTNNSLGAQDRLNFSKQYMVRQMIGKRPANPY